MITSRLLKSTMWSTREEDETNSRRVARRKGRKIKFHFSLFACPKSARLERRKVQPEASKRDNRLRRDASQARRILSLRLEVERAKRTCSLSDRGKPIESSWLVGSEWRKSWKESQVMFMFALHPSALPPPPPRTPHSRNTQKPFYGSFMIITYHKHMSRRHFRARLSMSSPLESRDNDNPIASLYNNRRLIQIYLFRNMRESSEEKRNNNQQINSALLLMFANWTSKTELPRKKERRSAHCGMGFMSANSVSFRIRQKFVVIRDASALFLQLFLPSLSIKSLKFLLNSQPYLARVNSARRNQTLRASALEWIFHVALNVLAELFRLILIFNALLKLFFPFLVCNLTFISGMVFN